MPAGRSERVRGGLWRHGGQARSPQGLAVRPGSCHSLCHGVLGCNPALLVHVSRSLELSRCSHVPGAVLAASARNWASLTRLNVCWLPIDNKQAQVLVTAWLRAIMCVCVRACMRPATSTPRLFCIVDASYLCRRFWITARCWACWSSRAARPSRMSCPSIWRKRRAGALATLSDCVVSFVDSCSWCAQPVFPLVHQLLLCGESHCFPTCRLQLILLHSRPRLDLTLLLGFSGRGVSGGD